MVYKFCKFQANWLKTWCTWFFGADPYLLKMTIDFFFYFCMDLKIPNINYLVSPELNHTQVNFGVNPFIRFEVIGQNVILSDIWLIHIIWIRKRIILTSVAICSLQFRVHIDSIDLTWHHVAACSHLATSVMTDRQTHTHRQTPQVKNIIPFSNV